MSTSPRGLAPLVGPVLATVLGAALLTGCGGQQEASPAPSDDPPSASVSPSTPPPTPAPTSSAEASPSRSASPSEPSEPPDQREQTATMTITDFTYRGPGSVAPGQQIEVVNRDDVAHTVTARDGPDTFDVNVPAGATVELVAPDRPGRYAYYCVYHANMTGTLTVA